VFPVIGIAGRCKLCGVRTIILALAAQDHGSKRNGYQVRFAKFICSAENPCARMTTLRSLKIQVPTAKI
jgi:hypothetical protein